MKSSLDWNVSKPGKIDADQKYNGSRVDGTHLLDQHYNNATLSNLIWVMDPINST